MKVSIHGSSSKENHVILRLYPDMSSWAGMVPPRVPAMRLLIAIVAMPSLVSFVALPM